ncbi:MAG: hypothetical protein ACYC9L_07940 [Sulfuricaulis sp.]
MQSITELKMADSAWSDIAATSAEKIVNDVKDLVSSTWYNSVRAGGVSEKNAETIRGTFTYPGFSQ